MLTLKYEKTYPASTSSHIDTLRLMGRLMRRAKVGVDCSRGFNPHMLMFFSPALGVGIESVTEFVSAETSEKGILERLNAVSPKGIKFTAEYSAPKNPNLAAVVRWAEYEFRGVDARAFLPLLGMKEVVITYDDKGEAKSKDIRKDIHSLSVAAEAFPRGNDGLSSGGGIGGNGLSIDNSERGNNGLLTDNSELSAGSRRPSIDNSERGNNGLSTDNSERGNNELSSGGAALHGANSPLSNRGFLRAVISCGNINLRADRFIEGCSRLLGLSENAEILKVNMFDENMKPVERAVAESR